jgi:hypothetical protein
MDHQPFEVWLLNDERLTPEQDRELRVHLRNCPQCAALSRANLSLRSAAVIAPEGGFALRFQVRLAAQRKLQRRQSLVGLFLLALVGGGALFWLLFPFFPFLELPPAQLGAIWISNLVYIALMARALGAVGIIFINLLASFIPTYVWLLLMVVFGGTGLLWAFSFRKVGIILTSVA